MIIVYDFDYIKNNVDNSQIRCVNNRFRRKNKKQNRCSAKKKEIL